MAVFVLVHGAWHGGWCWKRTASVLRAAGHDVYTPTLTGLADCSHLLNESIGLNTHITDVVNLICWEDLSDVILCGHSYGGMVVSGVADLLPGRIRTLVYLDAFVPENGESLERYIAPNARELPFMPPLSMEYFRLNSNDAAWAAKKCTVHPTLSWKQPITLGDGIKAVSNCTYIQATGWQETFKPHMLRAKERGWKVLTVDCGHEVMLDRPEFLTQALLAEINDGK